MNSFLEIGNEKEIAIPVGQVVLHGNLHFPEGAAGLIVFAHGSGSSRHSPRNRYVAEVLNMGGLATLLMDLLTPDEQVLDEESAQLRFDIPFLSKRLAAATNWILDHPETGNLRIGYFGASTGAAAAIRAAVEKPEKVFAIVSRGGRPDLAWEVLPYLSAPTLLIVGGEDVPVLQMNQEALEQIHCTKHLETIAGATHLFEEPGALNKVARLAVDWFDKYL